MPLAETQDDWDRHWDDYADAAARNPAQWLRRKLILRHLADGSGPERVLDVGCGQGDLAVDLHAAFPKAEIRGVDYSQSGLDIAARKVPEGRFFRQDLLLPGEEIAGLEGWATQAVCSEVLEHVDDPVAVLRNARPYLAPGCRLVVTVPGGPMSAFDRHIGHRRHFTPDSLRDILEAAGYEVLRATGAGYPFFNLYRRVVILRGENLVQDASGEAGEVSLSARLAMGAFRVLFGLGIAEDGRGWQVVAVARVAAGGS